MERKMSEKTDKTVPKRSMTRRGFMRGATAAATFSIMKPSVAKGTEANSQVEAGIIGLGGRGKMIASMAQKHGGYQITSIADYFPKVAEKAGEQFSVANERRFIGLLGYKRLLESEVDAVFLETPPCFFPEHAEAAIEAGCHAFVAKPVGCDVPGCMTIAEAGKKASASEKVFLVDFQTRTDPFYIEGIKLIRQGDFGEIGLLSSVYTDEAFNDPPLKETIESRLQYLIWVNDVALGGGYLVNAGIHAVDVALWIAGKRPVSAMGSSRVVRRDPNGDSKDVYSLTYQFENGLVLNHRGEHLKNRHAFQCDCLAYCQDGYLETGYTGKVRILGMRGGYRGGEVKRLYTLGAERNIDTFHKNIMSGAYDNPTVEPAVNATLATILGRDAAKKNNMLTWAQMIKDNEKIEVDLTGLTM